MYNHIIVTTTCERIFSLFNIFKDLCLYDNHLKDVAIIRFFKVSQHQAWTRLSILLLKMNLNLRQKLHIKKLCYYHVTIWGTNPKNWFLVLLVDS